MTPAYETTSSAQKKRERKRNENATKPMLATLHITLPSYYVFYDNENLT